MSSEIQLIHGDCLEEMKHIPDESIDLIVTSPPYLNLRKYSYWDTYEAYLLDLESWFGESARLLPSGRHSVWNVQPFIPGKLNGERYHYPLSADLIMIAYRCGLMLERTLIWNKTNAVCQRMFGSYPYPPTTMYTPNTEDIHIFKKMGKADLSNKNEASQITKDEWIEWTLPIWDMPVGYSKQHPATFPLELPTRVIRLHSFEEDTVFDPFTGLGTTGAACVNTNRNFIGTELDKTYFELAKERIKKAQALENSPKQTDMF